MAWVNRPKKTIIDDKSNNSASCEDSTAPESCSPQTTATTRRCIPLDGPDNVSPPDVMDVDITTLSSVALTVPVTRNHTGTPPLKSNTRRGRTNTRRVSVNSKDSCTAQSSNGGRHFVEFARLGQIASIVSTVFKEHEKISNYDISNLPWRDNLANGGELHGQYFGPINDKLQPHGMGILMLGGNNFLKFHGRWVNGELVSFPGTTQRLLNEDEKIEYDRSARSARIFSDDKSDNNDTNLTLPEQPQGASEMDGSNGYMKSSSTLTEGGSELFRTTCSIDDDYYHASMHTTSERTAIITKADCKFPPKQEYRLGEVARTPRHMIIHRSSKCAVQSLSTLQKLDQAFIKRSNGLW